MTKSDDKTDNNMFQDFLEGPFLRPQGGPPPPPPVRRGDYASSSSNITADDSVSFSGDDRSENNSRKTKGKGKARADVAFTSAIISVGRRSLDNPDSVVDIRISKNGVLVFSVKRAQELKATLRSRADIFSVAPLPEERLDDFGRDIDLYFL